MDNAILKFVLRSCSLFTTFSVGCRLLIFFLVLMYRMKKILLIEDDLDILENTTEYLELSGFNVIMAKDGAAGVEAALTAAPDLVLCDIMMPVLNGYGVFFSLNKNPLTAGIPFIFLTAKSQIGDKKFGLDLGADDYIIKPFDMEFLVATINNRLEKQARVQTLMENSLRDYVQELENMLNITSHKVRSPLCTCMGLVQLLEYDKLRSLTEVELNKTLQGIKDGMTSLDGLTHELNDFINNLRNKKIMKLGGGKY